MRRRPLGTLLIAIVAVACSDPRVAEPMARTSVDAERADAPDTAGDTTWDVAAFTGTDIWVDPVGGDDGRDGASRQTALRTVGAAWERIPAGETLTTGTRIMLASGDYPAEGSVNYWEDRRGTDEAPIIVMAADGPHTANFAADINMFGVSHFALVGVDILREGDAFHCEQCDHVLIRDAELSGGAGAHETIKINQSQHITIEDNDIHGADDNNIDFVAVQHATVRRNRIHDAQDWCMYAKGGSADVRIEDNDVHDCGTGGITAGQGTGFEFMVAPWLNYEAYDVDILRNTIHDVEGAGLGVAGGFDILLAHNTLYSVGSRSHAVEFTLGRRGCDGSTDVCAANRLAGGWGTTGSEEQYIPNRHVWFVDNVVLNPEGHGSRWQHFQIDSPVDPPADSGVPSPARADDDLHIVGNVVWNGPADFPTGTGDGCPDDNSACNESQLRADNAINTIRPELVDPTHGDYRLTTASAAALPPAVAVPASAFDTEDTPLPIPPGSHVVVAAGGPPGVG